METIRITTKNHETYSSVSNFFIDYYMADANGEFVKIYLYLVRLLQSNQDITIAHIADHFNMTQKDICRAIKYWIKQDVLQLEYTSNQVLTGITLLPLHAKNTPPEEESLLSMLGVKDDKASLTQAKEPKNTSRKTTDIDQELERTSAEIKDTPMVPKKVSYKPSQIESKKQDPEFGNIIFQLEVYFGKPLTQTETNRLLYISEELHFSSALLEYLIEYCVSIGKKSTRYMETIAVEWYQNSITTVDDAKVASMNYNAIYLSVLNALKIPRRSPTNIETDFINTWYNTYAFDEEIILEACNRAITKSPQTANFPYVNGILEKWHQQNVRKLSDIKLLDEKYKAERQQAAIPANNRQFNNYQSSTNKETVDELASMFLNETNQ